MFAKLTIQRADNTLPHAKSSAYLCLSKDHHGIWSLRNASAWPASGSPTVK